MAKVIGRQYFLIVLAVALLSIPVSFILMPREKEAAFMRFHDMDFEGSLKIYQKLWESGDHSHNVMTQLGQLYLQYGELAKAIEVMETFFADHQDSYEVLEKLSTLYQYNQQTDKYLQTLEKMHTMRPSETLLRELSKLYNYNGMLDQQIAALEKLVNTFSPVPQDYVDLAYLYGTKGNVRKAQEMMRRRFALPQAPLTPELIELYVDLLLDTDNAAEAVKIIKTFCHDPFFAADLALLLNSRGAINEARQVLEPYLEGTQPHPKALAALTEIDSSDGQVERIKTAFDRLAALYRAGALTPDLLDTLLSLALTLEENALIGDVVRRADLRKLSKETLLMLTAYALRTAQPDIAREIQKNLNGEFLDMHPVARETLHLISTGKRSSSASFALDLEKMPLSEKTLEAIVNIAMHSGFQDAVLKRINRFVREEKGGGNPIHSARMYINLNKAEEGYAAFSALRGGSMVPQAVTHAWAILATASGHIEEVRRLIAETGAQDYAMLNDIYYVARDYHRHPLALEAARKIYSLKENDRSRALLAGALVVNGAFEEALAHLRPLIPKGEYEVGDYIAAVVGTAKTVKGQKPKQFQADLKTLMNEVLPRHPLTPIEARDFAFFLYENGLKEQGDALFTALAENPKAQSIELDGLAAFWSARNAKTQVPWLWQRARASSGKRLALWLSLLLEANQTAEVVRYIHNLSATKTAVSEYTDLYYTAMLRTKKIHALEPLLTADIKGEQGIRRLLDLAGKAREAELSLLAKQALERVALYLPQNIYVMRLLGYAEYDAGEYEAARHHILAYLASGNGDYVTHYIAGDMLAQAGETQAARAHFSSALEQLERLPPATTEQRSLKAELLLRLGREEEALALYRTLYEKTPQNANLKADFANALIQLKRYKEAERVLEVNETEERQDMWERFGKTVHNTYENAHKRVKRLWKEM